ncbi:MAG: hypothetical protein WD316_00355 [Phycisphaeraceae bacterium]
MGTKIKLLGALMVAGVVTLGGGCSPTSPDGIRANWSPELHSANKSFEQHRNMEARAIDMNLRHMFDDGARLLLVHRPSRLTAGPQPW